VVDSGAAPAPALREEPVPLCVEQLLLCAEQVLPYAALRSRICRVQQQEAAVFAPEALKVEQALPAQVVCAEPGLALWAASAYGWVEDWAPRDIDVARRGRLAQAVFAALRGKAAVGLALLAELPVAVRSLETFQSYAPSSCAGWRPARESP
jgi:hypothetical protein